jgi:hypothetical protein
MQPAHKMVVDLRTEGAPRRNVDDIVMGGIAESRMAIEDGAARFRGVVSLETSGGEYHE